MNKSKQKEEGSKQHRIYDDISMLFIDVEIIHGFTDITRDNDAFYTVGKLSLFFFHCLIYIGLILLFALRCPYFFVKTTNFVFFFFLYSNRVN